MKDSNRACNQGITVGVEGTISHMELNNMYFGHVILCPVNCFINSVSSDLDIQNSRVEKRRKNWLTYHTHVNLRECIINIVQGFY